MVVRRIVWNHKWTFTTLKMKISDRVDRIGGLDLLDEESVPDSDSKNPAHVD